MPDPHPGVPPEHPGLGSADPSETDLAPEEEPVTTGTLFLTLVILMIIGAVWIVMYRRLLDH